jgi:hypothetical protein
MENKKVSSDWVLSAILQIILSLAFSGGIGWLITEFKEQLPAGLYKAVWIVIAIVLIVSLISFTFSILTGRSFTSLFQWIRVYREKSKRLKVARYWDSNWMKLCSLLEKAFDNTSPPSAEDNGEFLALHFKFMKKRNNFLSDWRKFLSKRPKGAIDDHLANTLGYRVLVESKADPFSMFYYPTSIKGVASLLGIQKDLHGEWQPDEEVTAQVRYIMVQIMELLTEYIAYLKE